MLTRRLPPDSAGLGAAAAILKRGGLVAFPTETVYGLGGDARSPGAVARVYAAKDRPRFNPLITHVGSFDAARAQGHFGADARRLAEGFWPGALTLVVPATPDCGVCDLARAGLASVALRVPSDPVARALLEAADLPVAAPSANRSGRISPTAAAHVLAELDGRIDAVVEGGSTKVGLESTIVSCLDIPRLLRPGGITRRDLERVLGRPLRAAADADGIIAPGQLASHYAPRAYLRLEAATVEPGEAGLDFGGVLRGKGDAACLDLSPRGDLAEGAANLFAFLRRLDALADVIAVAPIPLDGLGEAINDRLARAAGPRPR